MTDIPNLFGSMVFNDAVMQARLPDDTYRALRKTMARGTHLELEVANVVASAMKDWALEKGATHFTHWFQPMTGITAEKHDGFISPSGDGRVIMEFNGKELVRGEPDASSFPSGGLRATFEARGYTAWDPTSFAFIKDGTLCVPTAFCSYCGDALDKKTPLLRSMQVIDKQAMRILRLFGNMDANRVIATVGPEQEYFLIDREMYQKRPDLVYCGRTLFGARPPKGQELDDHYFGAIKPRVSAFMKDLEQELWKLGIPAKTKHNEVAPGQHELAPVFETVNIATDHNQLTMETARTVAVKHGLVCLLHEKPFAGVNGSGKHNNWSLSTDTGANLLEPGDTPFENAQFLLFLVAVIKAVDDYQDLLRLSVAGAGNDHRLGANEAPPAIVSMFLGDELTDILTAIETNTPYAGREKTLMEIGVTALPHFPKDTTDRNRTSAFAFTGNKFEFRMPGSSVSISGPNFVLNTIVAESLSQFADSLENAADFKHDLAELIRKTIREHKRIIFNGNNYADEWIAEAEERGLLNLKTCVEALPVFILPKNIRLFEKHNVLSEREIRSRYEILLENYCKTIHIEALTMLDIVKKDIIPAVVNYQDELAQLLERKRVLDGFSPVLDRGPSSRLAAQYSGQFSPALEASLSGRPVAQHLGRFSPVLEASLLTKISGLAALLAERLENLENIVLEAKTNGDKLGAVHFYRYTVGHGMSELRLVVDELETLVGRKHWSLPAYAEILYSVS